ncbi:MAG: ABC transporter permease [Eubacteriales bacterium]
MIILIGKNLKEILNKKRSIFIAILPIIFFGVLATIYANTSINKQFVSSVNIGIIDKDDSLFSKLLIDHYEKNTVFTDFMSIYIDDEENVKAEFENKSLDAYLIIPDNFAEEMMYMEHNNPINVKIDTDFAKAIVIKNVINSYEDYIRAVETNIALLYNTMKELDFTSEEISAYNTEISYDLIMTSMERNTIFEFNEIVDVPNVNSINYFIVSTVSLLILYFGLYVGLDVLREKEQKTFQRLKVAGYSNISLIVSKFVSHVLYLFFNIMFWILIISWFVDIYITINLVALTFICITFSVSFSIFLSSIFKTQESILLVGNIYYFISAVIGGSIIPLQFLPNNIQNFSRFTPNYWFIKGLLFLQQGIESNIPIVLTSVFSLLTISFLLISSIGFKYLGDTNV